MLYHNKQELIQFLENHALNAQKHFGQNFLIDLNVLDKIIEAAKVSQQDQVIEVGPGLGILTSALLATGAQVTSIELDNALWPILEENFGSEKYFKLIKEDCLKVAPPQTAYKVVANIPYYITSPIIKHFLQVKSPSRRPVSITLLVQKEVAEKICAQTGNHSVLSLETQIFAKPQIIGKIGPQSFFPAPKVDSAILHLEVLEKPLIEHPEQALKIIKHAFSQKRKNLLNCLNGYNGLKKPDIQKLLLEAGIDPNLRPQHLSIEEFEKITKAVYVDLK